jgi:hypothetical protein
MAHVCDFTDCCSFYEAYQTSRNPVDCELIAAYCHGMELPRCQIRRYLLAQNQQPSASACTASAAG